MTTPAEVRRFLDALVVVDGRSIAFCDADAARLAAERFATMNRDWWASPTEAFIYNEFADALRAAIECGTLDDDALLGDDATVLEMMQACGRPAVLEKLGRVLDFDPDAVADFRPRVRPKVRWIDPPVVPRPAPPVAG